MNWTTQYSVDRLSDAPTSSSLQASDTRHRGVHEEAAIVLALLGYSSLKRKPTSSKFPMPSISPSAECGKGERRREVGPYGSNIPVLYVTIVYLTAPPQLAGGPAD